MSSPSALAAAASSGTIHEGYGGDGAAGCASAAAKRALAMSIVQAIAQIAGLRQRGKATSLVCCFIRLAAGVAVAHEVSRNQRDWRGRLAAWGPRRDGSLTSAVARSTSASACGCA